MKNRRLVGFSRVFKDIHKELNLKDLDNDDDLIHIDDDEMREDLEYELVTYKWNVGYSIIFLKFNLNKMYNIKNVGCS